MAEKTTDFFVAELLKKSKIEFTPGGSNIKEIENALKTASKEGTDNHGFPEFTAQVNDFILVIEDKASIQKQVKYEDNEEKIICTDKTSIKGYAENGALHYAQHIISKTSFKKVFAFGCSGNEKHHIIRPIYVDEKGHQLLDKIDGFENFSTENIDEFYKEQILKEVPAKILETRELIKKSAELHEALRNYGQLGDKEKPLVVSAILLALQYDDFFVDNLTGRAKNTDGKKIFNSIENYMEDAEILPGVKRNKVLRQFNIIEVII